MSSGIEPTGFTATVPLTVLQAVNQMLKAIGQAEVMSLKLENMTEASQSALSMLSDTLGEVLSRGWHFNTEEALPIDPDVEGFINLPQNAASVVINPKSYPGDFAQRGIRLYDLKAHSFLFTKTVYLNVVLILPFEECPAPVRWYVMALAGRKYGVSRLPDTSTYRFTKEVEDDAWSRLQQHDTDSRSATLPESSPHFAGFRRGQRRLI